MVFAAETCVGLANVQILRKSNALADSSTQVDTSFAMLYVAQVRRFRLITYWTVGLSSLPVRPVSRLDDQH